MRNGSVRTGRIAAVVAAAAVTTVVLGGCSTDEPADTAASAIAAASSVAAEAGAAGSAEMQALCDQMIADGLSSEDATALAESNGYVARVGTIDGEPQALTMDYREDRFTFEVQGGVVVACTYG